MKKEKRIKIIVCLCAFIFFNVACNDNFIPKEIAYPKIIFPKKAYQLFEQKKFPYTFQYPKYAQAIQDSFFFAQGPDNPYWLNLQINDLNATIYLTYKQLGKYKLDQLIYDSYKITSKQVYKATSIQDSMIASPYQYQMVFYTVTGDAATTHQFFVSDKKKHFLRGSLYINTTPKEDSLKIVTEFIKTDIIHLLKTIKFKD